jgi:hypothetical protein
MESLRAIVKAILSLGSSNIKGKYKKRFIQIESTDLFEGIAG